MKIIVRNKFQIQDKIYNLIKINYDLIVFFMDIILY